MSAMNLNLNTAAALGAEAIPMQRGPRGETMSQMLKRLFDAAQRTTQTAGVGAVGVVQSLWQWIKNFVKRVAQRLGFKVNLPENLSEEQVRGDAEVPAEVEGGTQPPEVAKAALLDEAQRLIDHWTSGDTTVAILETPEGRQEIDDQIYTLTRLRAAFAKEHQKAESQLLSDLASAASAMGLPDAGGLRQMLEEDKVGLSKMLGPDYCDAFRKRLGELAVLKSDVIRVDAAIASLVDAVRESWKGDPEFAARKVREAVPQLFARGAMLHHEAVHGRQSAKKDTGYPSEMGADTKDTPAPSVASHISSAYNSAQTTTSRTETAPAATEDAQGNGRGIDEDVTEAEAAQALRSPFSSLRRFSKLTLDPDAPAGEVSEAAESSPAVRITERG